MLESLNAMVRGEDAWSQDLNLSIARFLFLGTLAYIAGFFPVQLAAEQGVLISESLVIFTCTYIAIAVVNASYLVFEIRLEEREDVNTEFLPLSVRGVSIHMMTLAYATAVAYLVAVF